jgi:hypothetical protein
MGQRETLSSLLLHAQWQDVFHNVLTSSTSSVSTSYNDAPTPELKLCSLPKTPIPTLTSNFLTNGYLLSLRQGVVVDAANLYKDGQWGLDMIRNTIYIRPRRLFLISTETGGPLCQGHLMDDTCTACSPTA